MGSSYSLKVTLLIFCLIAFLGGSSTNIFSENLSNKEYTIGPEDILEIKVWDNDDLNRTVEVSQEGSFAFPLIGKVHASHLSVFDLENLIKKRLADGYIIAPQVTVNVIEYQSQKVFLFGEVRNPGSYVLKRKTHIMELISKAGGLTDRAERIIKIVRSKSPRRNAGIMTPERDEENETIIMVDLGKYKEDITYDSFFVKSGDSIYVDPAPPAPHFFVTGEVGKPGEFKWENGLTIRQAISLAGGSTQMAAEKRTRVIRVKDEKEHEYNVNMDDLVKPGDIIKVPARIF